ncbi:MAG TPA: cytochrome P450 [Solirubrobacteraceae bacterium]|jgi:cytochrome P450|nr:cytochrome P450 [Solirubrobacteraceae bacterium]
MAVTVDQRGKTSFLRSWAGPLGYKQDYPPSLRLSPLRQAVYIRRSPIESFEQGRARHGRRFTVYVVDMPPLVVLSDLADIGAIATASEEHLHAGKGGALMQPVMGESAFVLLEQEEHSSVRNAIMPAFHTRAVQGNAAMIAQIVDRALASWPVETVCPLASHIDRLTSRVSLAIAIDEQRQHRDSICGSSERAREALCSCMLDMLSVMVTPLLLEPQLRRLPGWRGRWRRFERQRQAFDEIVARIITTRRYRSEHSPGARQAADLLDLLISARNPDGSPLSDRQVRDNFTSVLVAGHETTAATLAWAFQLLAQNPAVQERLSEEIEEGADDTYMNAVIQEVLRHRSPFLFIPPRAVKEPIEIGGHEYHPPGQLLAATYLLHHDPELYADPDTFMPERFLGGAPRPGTFLPWGLGRKRCPGRQFALLEVRTVLRHALSRWRVQPAKDHIERPRWRTAMLTPHAGSEVILRPRRRRHQIPASFRTAASAGACRGTLAVESTRGGPGC